MCNIVCMLDNLQVVPNVHFKKCQLKLSNGVSQTPRNSAGLQFLRSGHSQNCRSSNTIGFKKTFSMRNH